jgi:hypothetical protein
MRRYDDLNKIADEVDLSSLPILRIDQISRIDTHILTQSNIDASSLLQSILAEYEEQRALSSSALPRPSLASYIEKQIQAVNVELIRRAAADRIDNMLKSVSDQSQSNNNSRSQGKLTDSNRSSSAPLLESRTTTYMSDRLGIPQNRNQSEKTAFQARDVKYSRSSSTISETSCEDQESKSLTTTISKRNPSKAFEKISRSENALPMFVVAATEKKIRFYPKKPSTETAEESKEKDRAERYDRISHQSTIIYANLLIQEDSSDEAVDGAQGEETGRA